MFVQKNQRVYFSGRISSSPFTDEYPPYAVLAFLGALASLRDAQIPAGKEGHHVHLSLNGFCPRSPVTEDRE
jgi:hypothetical protein